MSYTVINHNNNTTTTKYAKSKAYLMWMCHHVYAQQAKQGATCYYSVEAQAYVVEVY